MLTQIIKSQITDTKYKFERRSLCQINLNLLCVSLGTMHIHLSFENVKLYTIHYINPLSMVLTL